MSDNSIEEKVRSIIVDQLGVESDKVTADAKFIEDLGADSLDTVELVMAFEENFDIEVPDEEAEKLQSVADVVAYIEKVQGDDIRYAAEMTRVVYEPDRRIDTFGDTRFNFLLLSELMDEVNVVRVRSGWVEAEKPKIIRPSIYNEISTEGFSGEAKRFFDWLSKNGPGFLTLLEYGFRFKRSEVSEEILHEPLDSVRGRLLDQVRNGEDTFMALIEGVDDAWEVSLLKFTVEMIQKSHEINIFDFKRKGLL